MAAGDDGQRLRWLGRKITGRSKKTAEEASAG
jgi:hypothetical protein